MAPRRVKTEPDIKSEPTDENAMDWTPSQNTAVRATPQEALKRIDAEIRPTRALLLQTRRTRGLPDPTTEQQQSLDRLGDFLTWLDECVVFTPELWDKVRGTIMGITDLASVCPEPYLGQAKALRARWQAQKAEKPAKKELKSEDEDEDGRPPTAGRRRRTDSSTQASSLVPSNIYLPPADHPIWGKEGIMHGTALKVNANGKNKSKLLDRRYPQRDHKVYGNNGLKVGDWWPFRIPVIFNGAHGASQAGVSGDKETGAYSIVVSGQYEDVDEDLGDVLNYCGPGSNENTDRDDPMDANGTRYLKASLQEGKPVRVLRASGGSPVYSPSEGIRYDGLYKVVSLKSGFNKNSGKIISFRVVRCEGQPPINLSRPTPKERRDFDLVAQTSTSGWAIQR